MTDSDRLVEDYLRRLRAASRSLPRKARDELLTEVSAHIAEARAAGEATDEAAARALLGRVGDPEDVAAAAGASPAGTAPGRIGTMEIVTVILLLIGGIVIPVVGWIAGVVLLWASPRWRWKDKLVGAVVWPGGLLVPALALLVVARWADSGMSGPQDMSPQAVTFLFASVIGALAPFAVAAWLLHRART